MGLFKRKPSEAEIAAAEENRRVLEVQSVCEIQDDFTNDWYVSRVENVAKHVKRAGRISKLINNNK